MFVFSAADESADGDSERGETELETSSKNETDETDPHPVTHDISTATAKHGMD